MARVPLEERRQQFIAAARSVIAEFGIEGATTRRIADAAEAPLATLHYCFDSKEALLWAMWETHLLSLGRDAGPEPTPGSGVASAAADALRHSLDRLVEDEELAVTTLELLLWSRRQDPSLGRRAFEMYLEAMIRHLSEQRASDESESLIRPVARLVAAAYDGLLLQWVTFHDRQLLHEAVDIWSEAVELYVATHRSGPGRRPRS